MELSQFESYLNIDSSRYNNIDKSLARLFYGTLYDDCSV